MPADAAEVTERWPNYQEGDFVITDYVFRTGETLPELKLHYRTLGTARRNTAGKIINGVLLLQGNTGTGANWLSSSLADELFAPGAIRLAAGSGRRPFDGRARFWAIAGTDGAPLYRRRRPPAMVRGAE